MRAVGAGFFAAVVFFVAASFGAFLLRYGAGWTLLVATVCLGAATLIALSLLTWIVVPALWAGRRLERADI